MLNKKGILWITGVISVVLLTINYLGTDRFCGINRDCMQSLANVLRTLFILIPTFIISLITYKMRDVVYSAWLKFVYVWVPLTIVLTFIAPEYDSSLLPITKGVVSFYMSVLFLIISIVIITVKYRSSKND